MKKDEDGAGVLRKLELGAGIYLAIVLAAAFWKGRQDWLAGLSAGGAIAFVNFRLMQWYCRKLIAIQKIPNKNQMLGLMTFKTALPLIMIAAAIFVLDLDPMALAVGLSAIVAALLGYAGYLTVHEIFCPEKE